MARPHGRCKSNRMIPLRRRHDEDQNCHRRTSKSAILRRVDELTTWASYLRATATYTDGHGTDHDPYTEDLDESEDIAQHNICQSGAAKGLRQHSPRYSLIRTLTPGRHTERQQQPEPLRRTRPLALPLATPVTATDIGADGNQEVLTYTLTGADARLVRSSTTVRRARSAWRRDGMLDYEDLNQRKQTTNTSVTSYGHRPIRQTCPSRASITVTIEVT